jgi:hypothetical protein
MALPNPMTADTTNWLGPGFTTNNAAAFAFKKGMSRGNTSLSATYYQEPVVTPTIFREWIPSGAVPLVPPTDFVTLTEEQVITAFGVTAEEVAAWQTTVNGVNVCSIQQSATHPYLYKVNNCRLVPYTSNPLASFSAMTQTTKVNLLKSTIPFTYGGDGYRGVITRTLSSGELSNGGMDVVFSQDLAYVFDYDTGMFTLYAEDDSVAVISPITILTPPAITCYIYKGTYGNFITNSELAWVNDTDHNKVYLQNPTAQVLMGTTTVTDSSLALDVSGSAFIRDVVTQSLSTSSDRRLKENIRPFTLPKGILGLAPRLYNYIARPGATELGLIAQEVEELVPELVKESGGMKSLQYDRLGVLLLPIVKEQEERIKEMETEMADLKELVAAMLLKQGVPRRRSVTRNGSR